MKNNDFSFIPHIWFMALVGGIGFVLSFFTDFFISNQFALGMLFTVFYLFFNYWPNSDYITVEQELWTDASWKWLKKKVKRE